ncbi:putative PRTRC system protein B [Paenibacillus sp. TCA20]|uniref:PRTRC system protein B n=1 Tax=Paenibacillus urinalis TaxID=521520 RepID=A0ABY7XK97_9BACL|nr:MULTISPECIES: hypothetical protein [Paenibacillus]WDI05204.1 hypothetical protein PUW25_25690 [Paenibacillus urinalis]GAK41967.1 putative PRTRC system protein B [Paenibacillus sp. TCA20]
MSVKIELHPEKMPLLIIEDNGVKTTKYVYADQIIDMLQSSTGGKEFTSDRVVLTSPALPQNTAKYAQSEKGTNYLFITVEETTHDVKYHDFSFESIPYPKMVFAFAVAGKTLISAYVAAYKDLSLRDTSELYRFPYSNVYDSGKLCYWTNELVHDLVQLQTFPYQWREVPNNDHIYFSGETNKIKDTLYNVFDMFKNKPFDYDILTPMNTTFGDWSRLFINNN